MRKKIVAGNWKMNTFLPDGMQLLADLMVEFKDTAPENPVLICPPFTHLSEFAKVIKSAEGFHLGAQNCYSEDSGAFTGEVSPPMLSALGIEYVILGHSERREIFNESNELITQKTKTALSHGLKVIFCCGEPLDIRKANDHFDYVSKQVHATLTGLSESEIKNIVIAYEPIWAIGTGETAAPQQAQEMHQHIRDLIVQAYNNETADNLPILYGGSVKPDNAQELFSQPDVDGGLVGGASLKADSFSAIIRSL